MASLSTIKPFLPIILTFLVPRGITYYRALKIAIKTRPQPRPLSAETSRGLNILFLSICLFFLMSFPSYSRSYQPNIFELTHSRLNIPTDMLFHRLALIRPLTPSDEALREKITTPITRTLYLRFGPTTLLTCPFCHPTTPTTYLLHHLPTNILLPHLLHLLLLGLATSHPISGPTTSRFRTKLSLFALALALLDIYLSSTLTGPPTTAPPWPSYWSLLTLRPISLCLTDSLAATSIYLADTNRLPFLFPPASSSPDPAAPRKASQLRLLTQSSVALQTALMKLRAFSVARSAVVRDVGGGGLKGRDDEYWRAVVGMEGVGSPIGNRSGGGGGGVGSVWEEEDEVMQAVAEVTRRGGGGVDVERVGREAGIFVDSVTVWLDGEEEEEDGSAT